MFFLGVPLPPLAMSLGPDADYCIWLLWKGQDGRCKLVIVLDFILFKVGSPVHDMPLLFKMVSFDVIRGRWIGNWAKGSDDLSLRITVWLSFFWGSKITVLYWMSSDYRDFLLCKSVSILPIVTSIDIFFCGFLRVGWDFCYITRKYRSSVPYCSKFYTFFRILEVPVP